MKEQKTYERRLTYMYKTIGGWNRRIEIEQRRLKDYENIAINGFVRDGGRNHFFTKRQKETYRMLLPIQRRFVEYLNIEFGKFMTMHIYNGILSALGEVKQIKSGKVEAQTLEDFIKEL